MIDKITPKVSILARLRWYLLMRWLFSRWNRGAEVAPDLSQYPESWDYIPAVKRYQARSSEKRTLGGGLPDHRSWVEAEQFREAERRAEELHDPEYLSSIEPDDDYPKLGKSR